MDRRQINQAQSFLSADEYTEKLLSDFTHQPPTPVDPKFAPDSYYRQHATALNYHESALYCGAFSCHFFLANELLFH